MQGFFIIPLGLSQERMHTPIQLEASPATGMVKTNMFSDRNKIAQFALKRTTLNASQRFLALRTLGHYS
jgi:hypothetical protein